MNFWNTFFQLKKFSKSKKFPHSSSMDIGRTTSSTFSVKIWQLLKNDQAAKNPRLKNVTKRRRRNAHSINISALSLKFSHYKRLLAVLVDKGPQQLELGVLATAMCPILISHHIDFLQQL